MKTEEELRAELYESLADLFPINDDEREMIESYRFEKQRKHIVCVGENFSPEQLKHAVNIIEQSGHSNLELSCFDLSVYAILDKWRDNEIEAASNNIRARINWLRPPAKKVP